MTTQAIEVVRPRPTTISARIMRMLRSTPVHIALIALAVIWLVPSVGLLITSFRPRPDIASSGWWTAFSSMDFTLDNYRNVLNNQGMGAAFRNSLDLVMLSIHQDFVDPDPAERNRDIEHTKKCIGLAAQLGIPAIRLNSGRWNTIKSFDDLMKVKGDEPPISGHTEDEAIKWCVDSIEACSNSHSGGRRNWMTSSVSRRARRLPERR